MALSLSSVLGEWEVWADVECAAWGQEGASELRSEPRQGRAQGASGYVMRDAKDPVFGGATV